MKNVNVEYVKNDKYSVEPFDNQEDAEKFITDNNLVNVTGKIFEGDIDGEAIITSN